MDCYLVDIHTDIHVGLEPATALSPAWVASVEVLQQLGGEADFTGECISVLLIAMIGFV